MKRKNKVRKEDNMETRPNFLLFFSDQHRGDWMPYPADVKRQMGVEKLDLKMPAIRSLMDRGVCFTCGVSPAPVCAPARACLASGRRYRNCRVYQNNVNYDPALPSFYGLLQKSGYYVTGAGKFDLNKGDLDWGNGFHDTLRRMGFSDALDSEGKMDAVWAVLMNEPGPYGKMLEQHGCLKAYVEDMLHRGRGTDPAPVPPECYADNWIGQEGRDLIARLPQDSPWFLQLNFSGPHDPWDVTEKMHAAVQARSFPAGAGCPEEERAHNLAVRKNYAAMIENIDSQIGRCLEALQARGMLENTIVIYAADHGELMGDHGLYGKSRPEQGAIHIPLVIDASRWNGKQGLCLHTPVELQDLAATFLDYAGVAVPENWESCSLRPLVEGTVGSVRPFAVSELITRPRKGPLASFGCVTDGEWKLILRPGEEDRLYHLTEDPFEQKDLARYFPGQVERLRQGFDDRGGRKHPALLQYTQAFHN